MRFFGKRGGKIGVIELFGSIGGTIRSADYDQIFTRALEDKKIKAVVLDIDSPGGAVPASDYIYRRAKRVAEYKPVVASIRGVGASGGYYIACAAHRIVAVPGALVGSIGVLSVRPVLQELLHRVGVTINVSKSGEFKTWAPHGASPLPKRTGRFRTSSTSHTTPSWTSSPKRATWTKLP